MGLVLRIKWEWMRAEQGQFTTAPVSMMGPEVEDENDVGNGKEIGGKKKKEEGMYEWFSREMRDGRELSYYSDGEGEVVPALKDKVWAAGVWGGV